MEKIDVFEKYHREYDQWFIEHEKLYNTELDTIRELIPPFKRGLEIGVGTGRFAQPLGIQTGLEPSENMAEKARQRGIDVHRGVAEKMPFEDESFDLALMVTTICFVSDALQSLKEAYRVLEKGGCLILGFIDKESDMGREYQQRKENSRFYRPATFFSSDDVISLLKDAGFSDLSAKQSLFNYNGVPDMENIRDGYGSGSFVAIKALKNKQGESM